MTKSYTGDGGRRPSLLWLLLALELVGLASVCRAQVVGTTNTLDNVRMTTGVWSGADPFAFAQTSNLLTRTSALEVTSTNHAARVGILEATVAPLPALAATNAAGLLTLSARITAETNRAQVAEAAIASYTNRAATALQPASTNGWTVAAHEAWLLPAATNAFGTLGPRVSAVEAYTNRAATALQPAATNGWTVSAHQSWVLAGDVVALVNAAVAANPGITNTVTAIVGPIVTNLLASAAFTNSVLAISTISNAVSKAALAAWWTTNSPYTPASAFTFTTNASGLTLASYIVTNAAYVSVPPTVAGVPVTKIGASAFLGRTEITSLSLPEGLADIGVSAFAYCAGLATVTIPDSVANISSNAFRYCTGLTTFTYGTRVRTIGARQFGDDVNPLALNLYFLGDAPTLQDANAFSYANGSFYRRSGSLGYTNGWDLMEPGASQPLVTLGPAEAVVVNGITNTVANGIIDLGTSDGVTGAQLDAATNGLVRATVTNGLATIAYVAGVANALTNQSRIWIDEPGATNWATVEGGLVKMWGIVPTLNTNKIVVTNYENSNPTAWGTYTEVSGPETPWFWTGAFLLEHYDSANQYVGTTIPGNWTGTVAPATGIVSVAYSFNLGTNLLSSTPAPIAPIPPYVTTLSNLVSWLDEQQALQNNQTNWLHEGRWVTGSNSLAAAASDAQAAADEALLTVDGFQAQIAALPTKLGRLNGTATNLSVSASLNLFGYQWLWNPGVHTYDVALDSGVTLQLGQEQNIYVYNFSGATLAEGSVVCASGSSNANPTVSLASNNDAACRFRVLGLVTSTGGITNNTGGYVTTSGYVHDLNTGSAAETNELWLATAGTYTNVMPAYPYARVKLGTVLRAGATNGLVFVKVLTIPDFADTGAASATQMSNIVAQATSIFSTRFAVSNAVTFAGLPYLVFTNAPSTNATKVISVSGVTNGQYLAQFVSEPFGVVGTLGPGTAAAHFHAITTTAGGDACSVRPEFYLVTSNGATIAEWDGGTVVPLPGVDSDGYDVDLPIPAPLGFAATDRRVLKLRAVTAVSAPTVTLYLEDGKQMSLGVPVPSAYFASQADLASGITAHNADTNAHPDKVATTNGTAYHLSVTLTNGSAFCDGVLNTTNGLFFIPSGSTNRYWILGGQ